MDEFVRHGAELRSFGTLETCSVALVRSLFLEFLVGASFLLLSAGQTQLSIVTMKEKRIRDENGRASFSDSPPPTRARRLRPCVLMAGLARSKLARR